MGIRVVLSGFEEFARRGANLPARLGMLEGAMDAHTGLIWSAVVPLTPVGVTSALRGSWQTETIVLASDVIGRVGSPLIYSEVIERGRRAGSRMPPPDALKTWVERKLGSEVSAFVVARSIGRRGFKGKHMLGRAVEMARPAAQRVWDATVRRLLEDS